MTLTPNTTFASGEEALQALSGASEALVRAWAQAHDQTEQAQQAFLQSALFQDRATARLLAPYASDLLEAFDWAAKWGWTEEIQAWLPRADPAHQKALGFRWACQAGHLETAQFLAQHLNLSNNSKEEALVLAMTWATLSRQNSVIQWLVQAYPDLVDPTLWNLVHSTPPWGPDYLVQHLPLTEQRHWLTKWEKGTLPDTHARIEAIDRSVARADQLDQVKPAAPETPRPRYRS